MCDDGRALFVRAVHRYSFVDRRPGRSGEDDHAKPPFVWVAEELPTGTGENGIGNRPDEQEITASAFQLLEHPREFGGHVVPTSTARHCREVARHT
ncbi:hypothetical protein GCM10009000_045770 [Halobacterium noricense]